MKPVSFKHALSRRTRISAMATLMLLPALASAHNYSFLEGGFVDIEDDSGFRIGGSFDLQAPIALFGEYADTGDFSQITAGGLYHVPLDNKLDLNLGASFEQVDFGPDDDTGFGLRAGLRWKVLPNLEIEPGVRYVNLDDDYTSARFDARFAVTDKVDLQAAIQGGDDDRFELGARYNFGPHTTGH